LEEIGWKGISVRADAVAFLRRQDASNNRQIERAELRLEQASDTEDVSLVQELSFSDMLGHIAVRVRKRGL
jgi:hypothetical protein